MEDDAMEEGELSESGFEDLYEPYLGPGEEKNTDRPSEQESADDEDYDPANPDSPTALQTAQSAWPDQPPSAESSEEVAPSVRERSRSYSPYLSPHEVEAQDAATSLATMNDTGMSFPQTYPYMKFLCLA